MSKIQAYEVNLVIILHVNQYLIHILLMNTNLSLKNDFSERFQILAGMFLTRNFAKIQLLPNNFINISNLL